MNATVLLLSLVAAGAAPSDDGPERPDDAPRPEPPATVMLPSAGEWRAPLLLRLAGELAGLPVRVQHRQVNDIRIPIPRRLARRHVHLSELRLVLAASSIFLVPWNHPEHGRFLVATTRRDWTPPPPDYRAVVRVGREGFELIREALQREVDRLNGTREAQPRPFSLVPVARLGKIYIWGPTRRGVGQLLDLASRLTLDQESLEQRMGSYRARHHRARVLVHAVEERLTAGQRREARIAAGSWGNVVIFRAPPEVAVTIERLLRKLDTPGRVRPGARRDEEEDESQAPRDTDGEETDEELTPAGRVDLASGEVPVRDLIRFISDRTGRAVVVRSAPAAALDGTVTVPAEVRQLDADLARAFLEAAGWRLRSRSAGGRIVYELSHQADEAPSPPEERRVIRR